VALNKDEAIATLDLALSKIDKLRTGRVLSPEHVEFVQTTGLEIARIFGGESAIARNFSKIDYQSVPSFFGSPLNFDTEIARRRQEAYQRGLDFAEGVLTSARSQLESHGVDAILTASRIRTDGARIFVSHGKETIALGKVERFLRAVGAHPIIVVRGPSEGMSVDDLVETRLNEADCAIILATADDDISGKKQPRLNVIHEIGLAQEKLQNKVIYLIEEGCEFPSNVQPKVWENFTQQNMEAAFEKIMKEMRAFGLLA
jgi:hypothetical protein